MSKSKRLLSVLVMAIMVITMFGTAFAAGSSEAGEKLNDSAVLDKFTTTPFRPVTSAKVSKAAETGILYVCNSWKSAKEGDKVYLEYDFGNGPEIYSIIYGVQGFATFAEAYDRVLESGIIKFGPGTYNEQMEFTKANIKLYGNYGNVCPNVDGDNVYTKDLNPARSDSTLETVLDAEWDWTPESNYMTVDGFTMSGNAYMKASVSGKTVTGCTFSNNIITNSNKTYTIDMDRGYNIATVVINNRVVNTSKTVFIGGGAMYDVKFEGNYFENVTGTPFWLTSCGNNSGIESLISFKNNVFNTVDKSVDFTYGNGTFGSNLDYKAIENNIFYNCGTASKSTLKLQFWPDWNKSGVDTDNCTSTSCKTNINNNLFISSPNGVNPINFIGKDSAFGREINYKATVSKNKFIFAAPAGNIAITSTLVGTIDASKNFYGECSQGLDNIKPITNLDTMFSLSSNIKSFVSQPFYADYDMTQVFGSAITLNLADDVVVTAGGFVPSESIINNTDMTITMKAKTGLETVDFTDVFEGKGLTYKVYSDFLLSDEIEDNKVNIIGSQDTQTVVYVVVTDTATDLTAKYNVVIKSNNSKDKAELRFLVDDSTGDYITYAQNGTDITIDLLSRHVYFSFSAIVSPSASYALYADAECKTAYADSTFYMQPGKPNVIYLKVTSGNGKNETVYKLSFNRTGSAKDDAKIFKAITPEDNILIFNNERKTVTYRPYSMVTNVEFKFEVSPKATYSIYEKNENGVLSNLLSSEKDSKEILVGDGITYYYIKVESEYGFEQIYTLVMYNDVKSSDNVVTGVTGIPNAIVKEDEIIIPADASLAVVNAHFETNVFADVVLYADENKQFKVTPAIVVIIANKREVEERTFQLGVAANVQYYYMEVTSETGETREYKVILKRQGAGVTDFADTKGHWAESYIKEASRLGLVTGTYSESTNKYSFNPNSKASRQEVAVFLCKSMGIDSYTFRNVAIGSVFSDSNDIPEWSYNYAKAVYQLGIMAGQKDGDKLIFNPTATITRQEFFQAISNLHKLDTKAAASYDLTKFKDHKEVASWALAATKAVVKEGIVEGSSDGKLNPKANITRAEIATIISKENNIVL